MEPYGLRLDGEGGKFPRERWGELAFEGLCWEWGMDGASCYPFSFRFWRYNLAFIPPSPAKAKVICSLSLFSHECDCGEVIPSSADDGVWSSRAGSLGRGVGGFRSGPGIGSLPPCLSSAVLPLLVEDLLGSLLVRC